jgi:hypothetical protein
MCKEHLSTESIQACVDKNKYRVSNEYKSNYFLFFVSFVIMVGDCIFWIAESTSFLHIS